jgi:hypothetical protein
MTLPQMPFDIVADAVVDTVSAIEWSAYLDGSDDEPLPSVRHWRGNYADQDERPAILVRIDGDEPNEADVGESFGVCGELRMNLAISLIVDADLATAVSDQDRTGLGALGALALLSVRALKAAISDPDVGLGAVADNVQDAGRGPDGENSSDEGRLVQSLIVAYRVRDDDPTVLLRRGVNA